MSRSFLSRESSESGGDGAQSAGATKTSMLDERWISVCACSRAQCEAAINGERFAGQRRNVSCGVGMGRVSEEAVELGLSVLPNLLAAVIPATSEAWTLCAPGATF